MARFQIAIPVFILPNSCYNEYSKVWQEGMFYEKTVYSRTRFINGNHGNCIRIKKQIQRPQLQFQ
jgi:hypothetical protein